VAQSAWVQKVIAPFSGRIFVRVVVKNVTDTASCCEEGGRDKRADDAVAFDTREADY
jgi:hypothetical protein